MDPTERADRAAGEQSASDQTTPWIDAVRQTVAPPIFKDQVPGEVIKDPRPSADPKPEDLASIPGALEKPVELELEPAWQVLLETATTDECRAALRAVRSSLVDSILRRQRQPRSSSRQRPPTPATEPVVDAPGDQPQPVTTAPTPAERPWDRVVKRRDL